LQFFPDLDTSPWQNRVLVTRSVTTFLRRLRAICSLSCLTFQWWSRNFCWFSILGDFFLYVPFSSITQAGPEVAGVVAWT
jgi:hypothetical protein